jgi:hypothetical protein
VNVSEALSGAQVSYLDLILLEAGVLPPPLR